ncbi:hypothetical protein [Aliiroseovarius lamellibrachiae]|uniref:hypothetical protein n=1 Tax=Aliiroseovarius lamellibrachiae TaxID=1924933 RepID=UPI001BE02D2B|nr:hypothetical protein [Aliiroseovarius lamellibrachiae]MBT2130637.1 hypothetical protein [Aliiroseovarius lamellibrachiae]
MNTENLDLFAEQRQRKSQIVRLLSAFCRKYRMAGFDARQLPDDAVQNLARDIIDFFECRLLEEEQRTPPGKGVPRSSQGAGQLT